MTESLLDNTSTETTVDPTKNYLEELVGDGKKFKTVEDLARGKYEADLHVSLKNRELDALTAEYKRLQNEYNAGPKLQEVLDKILTAQTSSSETPKANDNNTAPPAFDPSQLDSLLESKLQKISAAKQAQENTKLVKDTLQAQFGDGFSAMLQAQTQKLGLTKEMVDNLVQTSPDAIFRIMGTNQAKDNTFQAPPRSSRQSTDFAPNTNKRTFAYWKEEAKKKPGLFSDPKAHNQMLEDIKAIGEKAFYGDQ